MARVKCDCLKERSCGSPKVSKAFWVLCSSLSSSRATRQRLRAQTTSATVSGSVLDQQGGALPGVTVTMTSRTQGNVLTAVTDAGGRFVFPIVRPDTYTLQATLTGFKTAERTNLNVNANDRLATGPLTLEIGALTEEVSVTSPVTPLQSISGERSFTLQSQALTNIANNGRALFNFATLVPGALSQNTGNTELG